ncbi:MAG TPA: hypothetical protein VGS19_20930 [Streptosporangiaceae bacterium]|nr:hypothetical protein [Streptosporangiaceae bacterium]
MIIVVDGPSAVGKTTWVAAHCHERTVVGEGRPSPGPDRDLHPTGAAAHWAQVSAARWAAACHTEQRHHIAVCDTAPFKLHYTWSLWQTGHATTVAWHAELAATRQLFTEHQLGLADLVLVAIPDQATLAARRDGDLTRRRRNFDLHRQLAAPLRDWYQAISELDPHRVRWELPATGLHGLGTLTPRTERTGTDLFDAVIAHLPAR